MSIPKTILCADDSMTALTMHQMILKAHGYRVLTAQDGFEAVTDGPIYEAAMGSMGDAFGKPAVTVGTGGSIPLVTFLKQAVPHAEILIWGAEDDAAAIHSANERVDLHELEQVALAEALFFDALR